jgi:nucleotide-binding universal stress UspA family protein
MKTIFVPIDFSDITNPVLEASSALARVFQAKIVLAHVNRPAVTLEEYDLAADRAAKMVETSALEQLKYWQKELQSDGFTVEISPLCGPPAICIRQEAERLDADYIVVGSHGHGALYDLVVGSTASDLLKKAPCPVVVVPVTGLKQVPLFSDSGAEPGTEADKVPSCKGGG